jgi:hypothetical protein
VWQGASVSAIVTALSHVHRLHLIDSGLALTLILATNEETPKELAENSAYSRDTLNREYF